jgi:elongation factor P
MKASELRKGVVLRVNGRNVFIKGVDVQSPSSRSGSTLYKLRGYDLVSRQKYEASFKGEESLQTVDFERRAVQYLYQDADSCTFMDRDTYEQYSLGNASLDEERLYLDDGLEGITALVADGAVLGIELPATVALEIMDTAPAMKAASSSARTKPATLKTGLVVQVPEYLTPGEHIRINTATGEFISRA